MHPTKDEFVDLLNTCAVDWIVDNHVFTGIPYYGLQQPRVYQLMMRALARGLRLTETEICVIGSARTGFSLAPNKFGESFNEYSDIDICVVSHALFDSSWLDILRITRLRSANLSGQTRAQLRVHREHHYLYNGWMYPESIVPVLRIGQRWLTTFHGLSRIPELASRSVSGRLYRTWDHARFYHQWSLDKVKQLINK